MLVKEQFGFIVQTVRQWFRKSHTKGINITETRIQNSFSVLSLQMMEKNKHEEEYTPESIIPSSARYIA